MNTVTNNENVTMSAKHGDDITTTASPRPWRIPEVDPIPTEIWSADGTVVARGVSGPDAVLIVKAVNQYDEVAMQNTDSNGGRQYASLAQARREERYRKRLVKEAEELRAERDRLRDIVRRMLPLAEVAEKYADVEAETIKGICARKGVDPSVVDAIREKNANLLREVRAAIGEGDKP